VSFAAPLFLLALIAVPAVAVLYVLGHRRRRRAAEAFVRPHMRASVVRWAPGWRRHLPIALFIAAIAVLIVAVARPQATVAVPVERANVLLVTDESSSMQATDVAPTRLEAAKSAAGQFLDDVPGRVNVGAIGFSTYSRLLAAPTRDRKVVRDALETLRARGSTATGDALDLAITTLRRAPRPGERRPPAAIVLLSDGRPTRGRDVAGVAARAKRLKIPIFTVSLGTPQGVVRLRGRIVHVPPDDAGLSRIARVSGGQAFSAGDAGELRKVYDGLASRVSTRDTERELTVYLVALALLIVLAGATTSMRWFARPA
jgi:Ca-activated chloride channel family protein